MTQSFPNVLVDPDPFFEDWMTASTSSGEAEEIAEVEEDDGITIVSSAATSNFGVLSSVGSDDEMTSVNTYEENRFLASEKQSHLTISSIDSEESQSHFPPHWQSHLAAGASSILSLTTTESEYEHVGEAQASIPINRTEQQESTNQEEVTVSDLASSTSSLGQESLSLAPSSVPSSQLSQLPSIVRRASSSSSTSQSSSDSQNEINNYDEPEWFRSIDTDQEWRAWKGDMLQVLAALKDGEEEPQFSLSEAQRAGDVDPDWLLAAVLSLQPDLLTPQIKAKRSSSCSRKQFWTGVAAVLASVVVPVAVALVAGSSRPRVRA